MCYVIANGRQIVFFNFAVFLIFDFFDFAVLGKTVLPLTTSTFWIFSAAASCKHNWQFLQRTYSLYQVYNGA